MNSLASMDVGNFSSGIGNYMKKHLGGRRMKIESERIKIDANQYNFLRLSAEGIFVAFG